MSFFFFNVGLGKEKKREKNPHGDCSILLNEDQIAILDDELEITCREAYRTDFWSRRGGGGEGGMGWEFGVEQIQTITYRVDKQQYPTE